MSFKEAMKKEAKQFKSFLKKLFTLEKRDITWLIISLLAITTLAVIFIDDFPQTLTQEYDCETPANLFIEDKTTGPIIFGNYTLSCESNHTTCLCNYTSEHFSSYVWEFEK